jgi:uncharacterized cupin superfamily protein
MIELREDGQLRRERLGELAGAEHLGLTVYELAPGQAMHFHYHLQREELLVVLEGTLAVRTPQGWSDVAAGEVVAFPRGERGAHGYENRGDAPVRLLMFSEQNAPNVSVYPDTNEVGIYDVARPGERRFGALFNLAEAVSGYAGGQPNSGLPEVEGPR